MSIFGPSCHVRGIPDVRNRVSISAWISTGRNRTPSDAIRERIGDQNHDSENENRESSVHVVYPFVERLDCLQVRYYKV